MSYDYEKIATMLTEETAIPADKKFLLGALLRKSPREETREKIARLVTQIQERREVLLGAVVKEFEHTSLDSKKHLYQDAEQSLTPEENTLLNSLLSDIDHQ